MPIKILMPALSPTMSKTGGKIVKWHKKENDKVEIGDIIAEIETDKAVMEFESADEGVMAKILIQEGTSGISVNQVIAIMLEEGEVFQGEEIVASDVEIPTSNVDISTKKQIIDRGSEEDRIKISPIAKKIAYDKKIDIKHIKGTGPYGRIVKADLLVNNLQADAVVEMSSIRQVIAQRLQEAKQTIPHFYLTIDCTIDKLVSLKNGVNSIGEDKKLTITDLVIKAAALSIKKFPDINSSWMGNKILKYSNIDISVAVALDDGLITPIIRDSDKKNVLSISQELKDLASRARSGKLKPEEFHGGGFTISNLGMFGIKHFSAIINPPQSCIMAVGSSEKRAIVVNGKVVVAEMMTVTLSVDHRVVDGVLGAKFLRIFKDYIENPLIIVC